MKLPKGLTTKVLDSMILELEVNINMYKFLCNLYEKYLSHDDFFILRESVPQKFKGVAWIENVAWWDYKADSNENINKLKLEYLKYLKQQIMSKEKQVKINIPEGYVIDEENSTFELIKFKKVEKELPTSWENLKKIKGYYIGLDCKIQEYEGPTTKQAKNVFPTKELAEAALVLAQLLQLRDKYNDGWQPDWKNNNQPKYVIHNAMEVIEKEVKYVWNTILAFPNKELRDKFFENFKDLLEIAKPLL